MIDTREIKILMINVTSIIETITKGKSVTELIDIQIKNIEISIIMMIEEWKPLWLTQYMKMSEDIRDLIMIGVEDMNIKIS